MPDIKRASIPSIHYLLNNFPCVAILGARQIGKTTLLKQLLPKAPLFDLEKQADYQRIQRDPDFFLSQHDNSIKIDEAQLLPELFPALRVAIDQKRSRNGQYLISGSSSPELLKHITESLAGRMAVFELGGFSLAETFHITPSPIYQYLADKNIKSMLTMKPRLTAGDLLKSCLFGSYPEPTLKFGKDPKAFQLWMDNYFQSYIKKDVRGIFPGLNINAYQRFVFMLAAASGQILNASEFARSLDMSQPTVKQYFQIAHGTFVWRMINSYQKNISKRVQKMPKGHMRDTGLINFILKNSTVEQLQIHPHFGRIWETFVIEEILKGFQNENILVEPYYYRTKNQAEIDLILEGSFGLIPVEIKSGTVCPSRSLTALKSFVKEHQLPFGVVINNSAEPHMLTEQIIQIPAGCL